ncbi:hypothetical protein IJ579_04975 [bacterium]|nr:hypothetical protein [bacterium]
MPVESIKAKIEPKYNANNKIKINNTPIRVPVRNSQLSFQGAASVAPNPIVWLMDFIAAGGYAASFIIQDGLGFIFPRVGKGLLRGGKKKKDEMGNDILDKNGEPKRHLNWAYARKEGIREVITGPSAFIIPYFALKGITKKFGSGNNVRLDYIDGFADKFKEHAAENLDALKKGNLDKQGFYEKVFKDIIENSVNSQIADSEKLSAEEVAKLAEKYAKQQIDIEKILADKTLTKAERKAALERLGSVVDDFMALKKQKIGGAVNEMAINLTSTNGSIKTGSIGEMLDALKNYFDDAVKNTHNALKRNANVNLDEVVKKFTHRRMGTRILTNLGLFSTVALFYTQIPKLYNMGTGGKNPALMNDEEDQPALQTPEKVQVENTEKSKDVSFGGGLNSVVEGGGKVIFNNKATKYVSDLFELSGPVIQGKAMAILLYLFCIPPRLKNAQDKYDYGEIVIRDFTAFTALLFGAKALARLFSDGFTKLTGLALNKRDLDGRSTIKKIGDYLNPSDGRHSILTSKQLESKYTNLENYKGRVVGFMEFIKSSGGDVKKAFGHDADVRSTVEKILKEFNGKSFAEATSQEIEQALAHADGADTDLIKEFYELFKKPDGLLNKIKIQKLFEKDNNIKATVERILKEFNGKSFAEATSQEIEQALNGAGKSGSDLLKKLQKLSMEYNGLLNRAKTCNSAFGFVSTLLLVPGLIIALTDICKNFTDKRKAKEDEQKRMTIAQAQRAPLVPSNKPTMEGFLK